MFQPGYLPAQTLAGNVFIGSTTYAGIVAPAYNAAAQTFGLWNPAGSEKNEVLALNFNSQTVNFGETVGYDVSIEWREIAGG
jgi:hypothetical protein